jgi:hypothetical protein
MTIKGIKAVKVWKGLIECAKSWVSMLEAKKVCERGLKGNNKVWGNLLEVEKVWHYAINVMKVC